MPALDQQLRQASRTISDSTPGGSPPASRLRRPGWRDPRLLVGLVLVAASTLAGARLLAASDDAVTVWATAGTVRAGDEAATVELVPSRVRLEDGATESSYLSADTRPSGVFTRDLDAGELVPSAAVSNAESDLVDIALAVQAGDAPVDLTDGELVDVWSVPDLAAGRSAGDAERVLRAVPVGTVRSGAALGSTGRQVVVSVDGGVDLGPVLETLAGGRVVLVRVDAQP